MAKKRTNDTVRHDSIVQLSWTLGRAGSMPSHWRARRYRASEWQKEEGLVDGWGGRTSMGVAVPQTCNQLRPRRQVGYVERACPRTPPDLHLHLSMCLHPCIPCTQSARLLPALWKRNPSLPPSTLPHPPSQAIGPRGAAALDLTSLPSPLSLQYCRRAR
jgi:hypothetical protein